MGIIGQVFLVVAAHYCLQKKIMSINYSLNGVHRDYEITHFFCTIESLHGKFLANTQ